MAAPRGSPAAIVSASGVRAGSVKNSRCGRPFRPRAARFRNAAVRLSVQKVAEMAEPPIDAAGYHEVVARIEHAAQACGRNPREVTLVAVSKQQPWETIAPVLAAGQTVFGENRVQEAMARWEGKAQGLTLHLIGPLQTNKAKEAVAFFDVIETLDREKLARVLADEMRKQGRAPRLYVQVNTGEEPQKAGVMPDEADALIAACRATYGLQPEGLMCIPPVGEPPGPHFALLKKIAERNGLSRLSMGMSDDFETAIRFGATSVRVGSAIFGARAARRV
jgi:pyridoxal phosphate enzyme (YggS family)